MADNAVIWSGISSPVKCLLEFDMPAYGEFIGHSGDQDYELSCNAYTTQIPNPRWWLTIPIFIREVL